MNEENKENKENDVCPLIDCEELHDREGRHALAIPDIVARRAAALPACLVMIRRNAEHAARVMEIMGLPDMMWSDIDVAFGVDDMARASVTFVITPEQLVSLARLAAGLDE